MKTVWGQEWEGGGEPELFIIQEYKLCQVVQNLPFSCQEFNVETLTMALYMLRDLQAKRNSSCWKRIQYHQAACQCK